MDTTILPVGDVSAQLARLIVYPVKSCGGVELQESVLTETGLAMDRAWMVVDAHANFVTQRQRPRLVLVRPELRPHGVLLNAPGMPTLSLPEAACGQRIQVKVWDDVVPAFDMGDEAALWFTSFLGCTADGLSAKDVQPCRLVRFDPAHQRVSSLTWTAGVQAFNQFNDGFPLLVISEASLANLNDKLVAGGQEPVGMERFRPNVVLSGMQAHDEDRVGVMTLHAGSQQVWLKPVKPCPRCPVPNIDPLTALIGSQVGDTLQTYRQNARLGGAVTFGMNVIALRGVGAVLRVGQTLCADFDFG
jgi:uncharacterized protein YcbX